jgi:histidine ammonia-lyase
MIPQVTAAALVSENKTLAYPASVDSIPTSAGQEDHVSMAPIAARKAATIARNAAGVIAVELMAAAEGIDYHAPLATSEKLQEVYSTVRKLSPHFTADRYWADEISALQSAVLDGGITGLDRVWLS